MSKHTKKFNVPFADLIQKKRDGGEFNKDEIQFIIDSIMVEDSEEGAMPLYQSAALIMAIYFKGMSANEIMVLTKETMLSGEYIDLSKLSKPKIDRYAIGGVGDKTTLILPALSAACGVISPSMTSSDEDFIISNIDKLSVFSGFQPNLTIKQFTKQLDQVGCAIVNQNAEITPVNAKLYKLRQDISCIQSLPLITASVLSKKFAAGTEGLVIDVKWGNGSFVKDLEQAKQLARFITRVGRSMNNRCVALITDMNQPLGHSVGAALEIKEAIELLKGEGPPDLKDLLLKLGMEIVRLAGVAGSTLSAKQIVTSHLKNGSALAKFKQMIKSQEGDTTFIDHPEKLPKAKHVRKLPAPKRGYVHTINTEMIARGVSILLRGTDNGELDHSAGVSDIKKIGTQVKQGEPLMMIHYNSETRLEAALEYLKQAYRLAPKRPVLSELIVERVA